MGATGTGAGAELPAEALDPVCGAGTGAGPGAPGAPGASVVEHTQFETVTVDTKVETETETEPPVKLALGAGGMETMGIFPLLRQASAVRITALQRVTEVLLVV